MALSPSTAWEVRTAGVDANGGGFVAGASGTDYSQQAAAQVTYADLAIGATATQLTSAASPFAAPHVGNILNVTGGTGFTAGRYQVVSVASGVATMDRAVGVASSTGGAGKLGGAIPIASLPAAMVAGNKAFVRSGTYSLAAVLSFGQGGVTPSNTQPPTTIEGYQAARGDIYPGSANQAARPVLSVDAALGDLIGFANGGWLLRNLAIAKGTGSFGNGVVFGPSNCRAENCKVSGFATSAFAIGGSNCQVCHCEATGGLAGATAGIWTFAATTRIVQCHVHDNACCGIDSGNQLCGVEDCLIAFNTGAASDGIRISSQSWAIGNTVHGSGRDGIRSIAQVYGFGGLRKNILSQNAGWGLAFEPGGGMPATWQLDGNAFYANGTAEMVNLDDAAATPINALGAYLYRRNATLSASPFVDAAGGDFRLNDAAGGGAACRGAGVPRTWPGSATVGFPDFGAAQHQDAGGGGSADLTAVNAKLDAIKAKTDQMQFRAVSGYSGAVQDAFIVSGLAAAGTPPLTAEAVRVEMDTNSAKLLKLDGLISSPIGTVSAVASAPTATTFHATGAALNTAAGSYVGGFADFQLPSGRSGFTRRIAAHTYDATTQFHFFTVESGPAPAGGDKFAVVGKANAS